MSNSAIQLIKAINLEAGKLKMPGLILGLEVE